MRRLAVQLCSWQPELLLRKCCSTTATHGSWQVMPEKLSGAGKQNCTPGIRGWRGLKLVQHDISPVLHLLVPCNNMSQDSLQHVAVTNPYICHQPATLLAVSSHLQPGEVLASSSVKHSPCHPNAAGIPLAYLSSQLMPGTVVQNATILCSLDKALHHGQTGAEVCMCSIVVLQFCLRL